MAAPRDPCLYKETPLVLNSFSPESTPITYTINANSSQTTRAPVEPASYQQAEQGSILRLNNDIQGYIFWQVVDAGCVLNLRYISLTDGENTTPTLDQTGPVFPVQFSFGGQIVPKVAFFEGVGIVLCLVLVKDILYRLRLPLKDIFKAKRLTTDYYTFAKLRTLQDRQPCIITVLDYNNFVVGCRDGAMFNYNYDAIRTQQLRQASPRSIEDTFTETELAEPLIKQLKNLGSLLMYYGKRSQSELDDNSYSDSSSFQPISMASHIDGSVKFIVSLSRDRRIKICSLPTGEHLDDRPLKSAGVMDNSDSEDDESVNNDANFDESTADQGDDNIRIPDLPPQSKSYICILGGGAKFSKTFNFLVYVPYLDSGLFALYRVRYEQKGTLKSLDIIGQIRCTADEFLKENARAHAFVKLVDIVAVKKFENKIESPFDNSVGTQVWTLWTLWDRAGRATVAYTDLKITFFKSLTEPSECVAGGVSIHGSSYRQNWMIVAHPLPERLNPTQFLKDTDNAEVINEEFLEYTLIPGRFSAAIIQSSLMSFITESSDLQLCKRKSQLLLDARDIRDKVKDYVTGHVVRQHDPETGLIRESQYIENLQAEWIRFLSKCHQFLEDAQKPISLMVDASSKFFSIIKRHGISVLRLCEALEVIHQHFEGEHNGDRLESISVDAFIPQYECLVDERERVDVIRIFKAADFVASRFQSDIISLEEQLVEGLLGVQEDPTITVAVNFYTQFMIKNIGEHSETIWSIVKSTGKWRKCVRSIIEMLSGVLEDKRIPDAEYTSSIFANALYASSTQQVIQTRYKISRNILLLLITIASSPYNDELMGTRKLLGSAMMTYYTQRLLMWMSKQCIPPSTSQEDNSEDNIIEKFSVLNFYNQRKFTSNASQFIRHSLIQSLLHHHYSASSVSVIKDAAALLLVGVHKFLRKIEMLDNHIPPTVMTTDAFVKLGDVFEVSGYASLLEKYLAFLHRTPAIMYLYGKLYLRKADYVNAKVNFDKAASGYVGNLPVPPYTGRPLIRSQDTVYADISAFYVHVADLFDNHKQDLYVIRYCKLALNAFNEMQKSTPEGHARSVQLWKRMFNRGLSSNAFEQAYWAAKSNPDQKIREEGLRCLIIDMIKKQEVESLHRMGFVGVRERIFEKTLESAIEDASLAGLHVAKIVHASYIQSGKYKQAAKVMYENAQRIGRNNTNSTNFFEMATEQAQSYLAAINSLELLTDRNAWFQINSDRVVEVSNPKRRKIDVSLPMEIDPSSARTDLVVIEEIRREYELIMAKLKLGKRIGAAAGPMNVKQVIATCTEYQEYETAATIAKAFNQDMTDIFRSITYKCMLISEFGTPQKDRSYDWIYSNQWASLLDGTEVTRAWGFLQYFIDEYDRIDQTEGRYRNAVLEVILTSKQNTKIPPWLSNFYKKYNPKDYVRLLLEHSYLLEAASFMIEYFAMAEDYPTSTPWMPYTTIDMILGAAKEYIEENGRSNEERDLIRNLIENLQNQLNRYLPNQEQ